MAIDIHNERKKAIDQLRSLNETVKPVFGIMTPQHMVEHLGETVIMSNGKVELPLMVDENRALATKEKIIDGEAPIPKGVVTPGSDRKLKDLRFKSLDEAIDKLEKGLEAFDDYFINNPNSKPMHPIMGNLNHSEWIVFHNKHFKHHFEQFELLKAE
jgi:oxepin-CoA hydrolase/3-oxo-5,6-dehydrosuberyl-CoA semialdehyde dehydrogenase